MLVLPAHSMLPAAGSFTLMQLLCGGRAKPVGLTLAVAGVLPAADISVLACTLQSAHAVHLR
jgi:hypothetical protein